MDDIITGILQREGNGKVTNDPSDKGGRTQYGIAEGSNPQAWLDGKVTEQEARDIYEAKYVKWPGYDKIPASHVHLKIQLIDYGVLSSPHLATEKLQIILGLDVDGKLGPETLKALIAADPRVINNKLVAERIKMIGRIVQKDPSQVKWLSGWQNRALDFFLY